MGVHNIEKTADFDQALKDHKVVVMDAYATWCGPCKVIAPKLVEFSDAYTDAHFVKVDVDKLPDIAQKYGVKAMPTFFIFKDGEKVAEVVGADPKRLEAVIKDHAVVA